MKKLMIAAVVAASVGVTFADTDAIYDFSASLKTTVGKMGKDSKTTTTYNLGWNGVKFWYDHSEDEPDTPAAQGAVRTWYKIVEADDGLSADLVEFKRTARQRLLGGWEWNGTTTRTVLVSDIWTRKSTNKKQELNKKLENDQYVIIRNVLDPIYGDGGVKGDHPERMSAGKWCATYKITTYTAAACYRAAGTEKINDQWDEVDDCCDLATTLLQRFGAQTFEKATKVEIFEDVGGLFVTENSNRSLSQGYIAGQGTWKDGLAKDLNGDPFDGVNSISGNIVGILDAPDCEFCCDYPTAALAFECNGTYAGDETAAYGTFTIKFNKSLSFKED